MLEESKSSQRHWEHPVASFGEALSFVLSREVCKDQKQTPEFNAVWIWTPCAAKTARTEEAFVLSPTEHVTVDGEKKKKVAKWPNSQQQSVASHPWLCCSAPQLPTRRTRADPSRDDIR